MPPVAPYHSPLAVLQTYNLEVMNPFTECDLVPFYEHTLTETTQKTAGVADTSFHRDASNDTFL